MNSAWDRWLGMSDDDLLAAATEFTFYPPTAPDEGDDPVDRKPLGITVAWRGFDRWAVKRQAFVLNRAGEWEYEVQPSSRDDDFLARCRYTRAEAVELALAEVRKTDRR